MILWLNAFAHGCLRADHLCIYNSKLKCFDRLGHFIIQNRYFHCFCLQYFIELNIGFTELIHCFSQNGDSKCDCGQRHSKLKGAGRDVRTGFLFLLFYFPGRSKAICRPLANRKKIWLVLLDIATQFVTLLEKMIHKAQLVYWAFPSLSCSIGR